jgi:hypothetical protein
MDVSAMAQQTTVRLVDDLDGSEAGETVSFSLDAKDYVIDLSDPNAAKLRDVLDPFVAAARRSGGGRKSASHSTMRETSQRRKSTEMRDWLRANGYAVKDRGRVPEELVRAYESKTPALSGQREAVAAVEFSSD